MTLFERAIYARAHEPRRLADLILVEGDPSDDMSTTRNVRLVIKGGVEMEDR